MLKALETLIPRTIVNPEVVLTVGVGTILALLIVPVPPAVLDVLLATNIVTAALILAAVLLAEKPLALSSFPTLLLLTTLFRLGLNVSTTRMILADGDAGEVVLAFGRFVARGDVVMGLVVFVVLTLVQLMVIGKGAERVAEVAARFTLDALPGKQMSIDAALRSGALEEAEANDKRLELGRESQFYGAMDGAMKFVKGDAIVGIIVTLVNLVAGFVIGLLRFDMSLGQAAEVFTILTIGDGLVSQIPSLLIALASGILTTRVASKRPREDLGRVLMSELGSEKALSLAGGFALVRGAVPGLPTVPFLGIGSALLLVAWALRRARIAPSAPSSGPASAAESFAQTVDRNKKAARAQQAMVDKLGPTVPLLGLDLGVDLSELMEFGKGRDDETSLLSFWIPQVRDAMFAETGIRLPGVRVRSHVTGIPGNLVVVRLKDVAVGYHAVPLDKVMSLSGAKDLARLGVAAEACTNPLTDGPASLVPAALAEPLKRAGVTTWDTAGMVALYLFKAARKYASDLVGLQETAESVKRLEAVCPDVIRELIPRVISLSQLRDVLRQLVREKVNIRDLKSIVEALGEWGDRSSDIIQLTEQVRMGLGLQLSHALAGHDLRLGVIVLEPEVEDMIRDGVVTSSRGTYLALDPDLREAALRSLARCLAPLDGSRFSFAVVTQSDIRFFVRQLVASQFPEVPVVSFQELSDGVVLKPLGRVALEGARLLEAA